MLDLDLGWDHTRRRVVPPQSHQKSSCTLKRRNRGCTTAVGLSHRSPPDAGSYVASTAVGVFAFVKLYRSMPIFARVPFTRTILARRMSMLFTRSPYSCPGSSRLTVSVVTPVRSGRPVAARNCDAFIR